MNEMRKLMETVTPLFEGKKLRVGFIGHIEFLSDSEDGDWLLGVVYHPQSSRNYEIYGYNSVDELKHAMINVYNDNNLGRKKVSWDDMMEAVDSSPEGDIVASADEFIVVHEHGWVHILDGEQIVRLSMPMGVWEDLIGSYSSAATDEPDYAQDKSWRDRYGMHDEEDLNESPKEVYAPTMADPKQVYEWVKTGHWSRGRFEAWLNGVLEQAAREGFDDGYQEGRDQHDDSWLDR